MLEDVIAVLERGDHIDIVEVEQDAAQPEADDAMLGEDPQTGRPSFFQPFFLLFIAFYRDPCATRTTLTFFD